MEQRYFIAIVPPEEIAQKVYAIKKEIAASFNSKAALRSPAHITLHMPFLWKEEKENILTEKLSSIRFHTTSIIRLNGFDHFGDRVIFINIEENPALTAFQDLVVTTAKRELQLFNQAEDLRGFHPHMTIAFRDLRKKYFNEAWKSFESRSFHEDFPLETFSLLKHDGSQWNVLRTFALRES